jgi:hypothetical protein
MLEFFKSRTEGGAGWGGRGGIGVTERGIADIGGRNRSHRERDRWCRVEHRSHRERDRWRTVEHMVPQMEG